MSWTPRRGRCAAALDETEALALGGQAWTHTADSSLSTAWLHFSVHGVPPRALFRLLVTSRGAACCHLPAWMRTLKLAAGPPVS